MAKASQMFAALGGRCSPFSLPASSLYFWRRPTETSLYRYSYGADFSGGPAFLQTAASGVADFNFNSGGTFSAVFFRNTKVSQSGTNGLDRTYIAHYDWGTSASWALGSGGSVNQGKSLRAFIATNASGTTNAVGVTPSSGADWSMGAATYDAAGATNADKLKLYLDSVAQTVSFTGTMPSSVNAATATIKLGKLGGSFNHYGNQVMNRVLLFNIALSQAHITALWNGGAGHWMDTNPATLAAGTLQKLLTDLGILGNLVGCWDGGESSGTRADSSGRAHHMSESGGTVSRSKVILERTDKASGRVFRAMKSVAGSSPTEIGFASGPKWVETGLNGEPCELYQFDNWLYSGGAQPINVSSCDWFDTVKFTQTPTENFYTISADEGGTSKYIFTGDVDVTGTRYMWVRLKDTGTSLGDNNVRSDRSVSANTWYLNNWRFLGAGGAASIEHRLNGVQGAMVFGSSAAHNACWDDVLDRDNLSEVGLYRSDGASTQGSETYLGEGFIATGLSAAENLACERYLAQVAGITLP